MFAQVCSAVGTNLFKFRQLIEIYCLLRMKNVEKC